MSVLIAILLGLVAGLIGAVPFVVARARIKKRLRTDGTGSILTGMVAAFVSFLVMALEIFLCFFIARDYLLPFTISAIVVFLLAMGAYTATLMRKGAR